MTDNNRAWIRYGHDERTRSKTAPIPLRQPIIRVYERCIPFDSQSTGKEANHEPGAEVLLDVKLRAASRQFGEQAAEYVQAKDSESQAHSGQRRLLRDHRR